MTRFNRLKASAIASCKYRGHTMSRFKHYSAIWANSDCTVCGAYVHVKSKILPNEVDIGGTAVALNCPIEN